MMLKCCEKCLAHSICVLKWLLAEKGFEENCCPKCDEFLNCFSLNRNARWNIIHKDNLLAIKEQID